MITPDDIRAEHRAAIAGFTLERRRAIERLDQAARMAGRTGGAAADHLREIFMTEAAARAVVS